MALPNETCVLKTAPITQTLHHNSADRQRNDYVSPLPSPSSSTTQLLHRAFKYSPEPTLYFIAFIAFINDNHIVSDIGFGTKVLAATDVPSIRSVKCLSE